MNTFQAMHDRGTTRVVLLFTFYLSSRRLFKNTQKRATRQRKSPNKIFLIQKGQY